MNTVVRSKLIELARKKRTIGYQELSDVCRLGLVMADSEYSRAEIGRILGEISAYEYNATPSRPLLSSLVIQKGTNEQGDGFYKLCEQLGFGNWRKLKNSVEFDSLRMNECFDFWISDDNYNKYF